jgi:hypothetical protein
VGGWEWSKTYAAAASVTLWRSSSQLSAWVKIPSDKPSTTKPPSASCETSKTISDICEAYTIQDAKTNAGERAGGLS